MLVEVWCDKFISNGKVRKPIRFHAGLNAVLGDDNGSNSIGKSTFLMILDFVFGGTDYVKKCVDVQENVKEHTICFAFDFDGQNYYFSRNTVDYNKVVQCDSEYQALPDGEPLSLQKYGEFLCEKYGLSAEGITWRGAIARFIRVYKRDTLDEERPLRSSKDETAADAIKGYMRLFDRYSSVEAQINQAKKVEDEKEAFRKSIQQYHHVRAAKNEKEKVANETRIAELERQEQELAVNNNKGLLDLDSMTARRLSDLTESLINYRRQRAQIQTQLNAVRRDMTGQKRSFKKTFADLERFFPNENFYTLEEIERFHQKLSKILEEEYAETEKNLATTYALLNNEIVRIQEQITEIKNVPNVSQAILKEFARITTELNNLKQANENYDELERLKKIATDYAETRDAVIADELLAIESTVNQQMREISLTILSDATHLPPVLRLEKLNKYTFYTPNDGGTGAQYRGLITFDLANMGVAPVPFVVHDSVLLKNIERPVFSAIIRVYYDQKQKGKQVFMAYDTLDAYDKETRELVEENAVLQLSPGGNELFGWAWNKEEQHEAKQE
ncbi:DUF2326 domain-containing protein [Ruminococcus bromii]|nr:DUF2326 domain-containing protein [Ruminococcus bromii]MDT4341903.1 DUF2326 domain-containing protein [Ruminococcus bromii]